MKALVLLTLGTLGALTGCSLHIGDLPPDALPPPPLAIAGPHDGLVYAAADDDNPELAGIQMTVRVDVDDEAIKHVGLSMPVENITLDDVVTEDLSGRRAAFFDVTLADSTEHPIVARAALVDADVEVQAVLVSESADGVGAR